MKPISLLITNGSNAVLPHILIPLQTERTISLEDNRQLFLPSAIASVHIVEPTFFGEWVLVCDVAIQAVQDETGTLPFEYIEVRPEMTPGYLVFLSATLSSNASLMLSCKGTEATSIQWILPRKSVTAGSIQKISGLFEVPEGTGLEYAIFSRDAEAQFRSINLERDMISFT